MDDHSQACSQACLCQACLVVLRRLTCDILPPGDLRQWRGFGHPGTTFPRSVGLGRPGLALVVLPVVEQRLDAVRAAVGGTDRRRTVVRTPPLPKMGSRPSQYGLFCLYRPPGPGAILAATADQDGRRRQS